MLTSKSGSGSENICSGSGRGVESNNSVIVWRGQNRYVLCHETGRSYWPAESYTEGQLAAIRPRPFADMELPCPGEPELYLAATYGRDWAHIGATHIVDHMNNSWKEAVEFAFRPEMYLPAMPFA